MAQDARRRICLIGPECTGKTTLARRAAGELGAVWTAEYARLYAEQKGTVLVAADVEPIARGQLALLDAADGKVVVHDTDLLATVVYARYYYGSCPRWIELEASTRRADLYLLFDTDVPWLPDGIRDAEGVMRSDLLQGFRAALEEFEARWELVGGTWEERWEQVRDAIARLRAGP